MAGLWLLFSQTGHSFRVGNFNEITLFKGPILNDQEHPAPEPQIPSIVIPDMANSGEEAFASWKTIVNAIFDVEVNRDALPRFNFNTSIWNMEKIVVGKTNATEQIYRRSTSTIARSDVDHFLVQTYCDGGFAGMADDREMIVKAGDVCVFDLGRSLHTRAQDSGIISIVVPKIFLLPQLSNPDGLHGTVLRADSAPGTLLSNWLKQLHAMAPQMTTGESIRIAETTMNCIAGCLGASDDAKDESRAAVGQAIATSVRSFIDEHLANPRLDATTITGRFGISRASLYRLFEPHGGVTSYIQSRRLARCLADLVSPKLRHLQIKQVAMNAGFSDQTHFSRTFKKRFGVSPTDVRMTTPIGRSPESDLDALTTLTAWMHQLNFGGQNK